MFGSLGGKGFPCKAPRAGAVLGGVAQRVVRELAYGRSTQWFKLLDHRADLGCSDESQREALRELKAARDAPEHNRGLVGPDYIEKAGASARLTVRDTVEMVEAHRARLVLADPADAARAFHGMT